MRLGTKRFTATILVMTALLADSIWTAQAENLTLEEGFTPIFNGQDLQGWEGQKDLWKVVDGVLVGDSPGIKQNEFLATEKTYSDFELRLEFRLQNGVGNTGIQFRSKRDPSSTEVSGFQADIGEKYWGCLYDEHRRNKILVQAPVELEKNLRKDGWNTYVIRAEGDRIILRINDIKTVDYQEQDQSIAKSGMIAVQIHSGGPLRVEFRNIRIKELKK